MLSLLRGEIRAFPLKAPGSSTSRARYLPARDLWEREKNYMIFQSQKIEKLSKTIFYFQTCKAQKIYSALVVQVRCTSCPRTPRTKSAILCNIKDQIKSMQHQTCTIRTPILVRSMHDFQDFSKSLLYPCLSEI